MNTRWLAPLFAALLFLSLTSGSAAAHNVAEEKQIVLDENGDATITTTIALHFDVEGEQKQFEAMEDDPEAQQQFLENYGDDLREFAQDHPTASPDDIETNNIAVSRDGEEGGIVFMEVTWSNFATVSDSTITVDQPFPEGYTTDLIVTIVGPPTYEVVTTENIGDGHLQDNSVLWLSDAPLDSVHVEFDKDPSQSASSSSLMLWGGITVLTIGVLTGVGWWSRQSETDD